MASRTLNLSGLSKLKLEPDLIESSFDRISRYYITARLIYDLAPKTATVLDVGGLGTILPRLIKNKITILDVDPNDDPNYVQGDATKQPFKDGQFDTVVTCDTLEHIPKAKRAAFIKELVRVADDLVIICAPFGRPQVVKAEKDMDNFYKRQRGVEHRWLMEHAKIGLPTEENTEKVLNELGASWVKFGHTDLENWRALMEANFLSESLDIRKLQLSIAEVNRYYNQELIDQDFGDDTYRLFYVVSKKGSLTLKKSDKPTNIRLQLLTRLHADYADWLGELGKELVVAVPVLQQVAAMEKEQARLLGLEKELQSIKESKGWRWLTKFYTAKHNLTHRN